MSCDVVEAPMETLKSCCLYVNQFYNLKQQ